MSDTPAPPSQTIRPAPFERPVRWRELRLASGLVLGAFLLTHFGNHALGLISLEAMEEGRRWFNLLWRNPPAPCSSTSLCSCTIRMI